MHSKEVGGILVFVISVELISILVIGIIVIQKHMYMFSFISRVFPGL